MRNMGGPFWPASPRCRPAIVASSRQRCYGAKPGWRHNSSSGSSAVSRSRVTRSGQGRALTVRDRERISVVVLLAWAWVRVIRRRDHLEISGPALNENPAIADGADLMLRRASGPV